MNPRQFCRERGYTSTIALTYTFDPLFFERVVLSDLWYGGTGDIVVVGDQMQVEEAITRCMGQTRYLGRRYHLTFAASPVFHPKMLLRIGPKGASFWLGTGNLTHGGWGGNHELAVTWKVEADDPAGASIVRDMVRRISGYCTGAIPREALERIADQAWLVGADPAPSPLQPLLLTAEERALSDDLKERWKDRRFTRMRIFTGSTDEGGRFLEWCHRQFGVEECVVAVNPHTASFKPELLTELPIKLTIAPVSSGPHMHAKFYWFEGPDGCAAVVGSANCSSAAWLLSPGSGGNVEAVFVYDRADSADFAQVLDRLPVEHLDPAQVPGLGQFADDPQPDGQAPHYRLVDLTLYAGLGEIHAHLVPKPPGESQAVLHVADDVIPLRQSGEDSGLWIGSSPEAPKAYSTQFGVAEISLGASSLITSPRWIDHHDELRHAARERRIGETLRNLAFCASNREKNQVLEDVELITKSLLSEPGAFPDQPREKRNKEEPPQSDAPRIKPGDLVRSLAEIEELGAAPHGVHDSEPRLTLHGVMRAIFGDEDDHDEAVAADEPEDGSGPGDGNGGKPEHGADKEEARRPEHQPPSNSQRRRLIKQIGELQENLGTEKFATRCTATQLVQAVSFPLACAALGQSSAWLSPEDARDWVLRTTDLLFRASVGEVGEHGLLRSVRSRYESEDRADTFDQVVADGTLWLALIGALESIDWTTGGGPMERALALREVVHSESLIASVDTGRLGALVPRLHLAGQSQVILRQAAEATRLLTEIEGFLEKWFNLLIEKQEGGEHRVGDLVWRKSGWGIVRSDSPITKHAKLDIYWRAFGQEAHMVASGYFVNFRWASKQYRDLAQLTEKLRST